MTKSVLAQALQDGYNRGLKARRLVQRGAISEQAAAAAIGAPIERRGEFKAVRIECSDQAATRQRPGSDQAATRQRPGSDQ